MQMCTVSLSPLKKGRKSGAKYFDGSVSDGKRSLRFVSFSEKQFDLIEKLTAKRGDELEIVMKDFDK